ncbi:MAG: nagA [Adhaeribacter sp.]|nr:nagA [Adhaeribacter sp.]
MAAATPARILGLAGQKGSLSKGKDADIIIFDEDIQVQMTMVRGRVVYQNKTVKSLILNLYK